MIPKAIWTYTGNIDFYPGTKGTSFSGTLMKNKTTGGIDSTGSTVIECIDFGEWIKTMFDINDYIILKLDIEGGEYDVLEKMIKDGSVKYINKLYIEWHFSKLIGFDVDRHTRLNKILTDSYGLTILDWHAKKILKEKRFVE